MGGTWREGHFDTGFGLKNDLQFQTGGIGIQRRLAIPVKRVQFLVRIGFLNLQMNGVWIAVINLNASQRLVGGCIIKQVAAGLCGEIGFHNMGQRAATRHRKANGNKY